jgi:integrase
MSITIIRRSKIEIDIPSNPALPSNLAEAKGHLDSCAPQLTRQAKASIRHHVNAFAKGLGRLPGTVPCAPNVLMGLVSEARPAAHGVDKKAWRDAKSGTFRLLRLIGFDLPKARGDKDDIWQALYDRLPNPGLMYPLSRLLGFLSQREIEPHTVCQGHFDRFAYALQHDYGIKNWAVRYRKCCLAWNEAAATIPGWPQVKVEIPTRCRNGKVPKMVDLTPSLQQDIADYLNYRAKPYLAELSDIDDEEDWSRSELSAMRDSSLAKLEYQFRRAVGYLATCGVAITSLTTIADLVEVKTFKRLRDHLYELHDQEANSQAWGTLNTLTGAARHWVYKSHDHKEVKRLCKLAKLLNPTYDGITEKNLLRLKAAIESDNFKRLLALPSRLAAIARDKRTPYVAAAHAMQTAVAIRLLLAVGPVRVSTLALTLVGQHLHGTRPGLQGEVYLRYAPKEIKNKVTMTFMVDPGTRDLVAEYMDTFRPRLDYGAPQALFPGEACLTKTSATLAAQIGKTIREHTGLDFNVHLFRHLAGYVYLQHHPGDYETVRRLLGHKTIETTMKSYLWIDTETAILRYQSHIVSLMEAV